MRHLQRSVNKSCGFEIFHNIEQERWFMSIAHKHKNSLTYKYYRLINGFLYSNHLFEAVLLFDVLALKWLCFFPLSQFSWIFPSCSIKCACKFHTNMMTVLNVPNNSYFKTGKIDLLTTCSLINYLYINNDCLYELNGEKKVRTLTDNIDEDPPGSVQKGKIIGISATRGPRVVTVIPEEGILVAKQSVTRMLRVEVIFETSLRPLFRLDGLSERSIPVNQFVIFSSIIYIVKS